MLNRSTLTVACLSVAGCLHGRAAGDGGSSPQVVASRVADATWDDPRSVAPEAMVYRTWLAYLESKHGRFFANAGTPSTLWVADEQRKWPMYDLAGPYLPDGAIPRVVSIHRVNSTPASAYEIVTRFTSPHPGRSEPDSSVVLTVTTYARQNAGRWQIANALPRKTASWFATDVGPIRYYVEPGLVFNPARAGRAAAFVDSLATAFGVPHLGHLDYYVTSTVDAAMDALGVDQPVKYGPHGGFSKPVNQQLFSGIPALGEDYRHELTHLVLRPLLDGQSTIVASEGIATWFGGTGELDFTGSVRGLANHLRLHPQISLDSLLEPGSAPQADVYSAGAVLCAMLADHGGVAALRAFLLAGPGVAELKSALVQQLGRPWGNVMTDWRQWVDRVASFSPPSK